MKPVRLRWMLLAALLLATACGTGNVPPPGAPAAKAARQLSVLGLDPGSGAAVARNGTVALLFSGPLDFASIRPGTVRVMRRDGQEQPVTVRVSGAKLVLSPPPPFGFSPDTEYAVLVEGFPSPLAPRAQSGRPLDAPYRTTFRTSGAYRHDLEPPHVAGIRFVEEAAGGWSVQVRFTEPVDPNSVEAGRTLLVTDGATGTEIPGRVIADHLSAWFRFLPGAGEHPTSIEVRLTSGVTDLAGNPLATSTGAVATFQPPSSPGDRTAGEIAEDFTTRDKLDPAETTALWDGVRCPGALLAEPASTILPITDDDPLPGEPYLDLGATKTTIRILLKHAELGPRRELTGIVWGRPGTVFVPAEYGDLEIRITPTTRNTIDGPGFDLDAPRLVLDRAPWRIGTDQWSRLSVPFSESYSYDGSSNLLLEIRVGQGDHTNFIPCRASTDGTSVVQDAGRSPENLRPVIALKSFSWSPVATSRFYDSGTDHPRYYQAIVEPSQLPSGVSMTVRFQGAHRLGADGGPPANDPGAVTDWVDDPSLLTGCRYLRFRIEFEGVSVSGREAAIDDLVIPFRRTP